MSINRFLLSVGGAALVAIAPARAITFNLLPDPGMPQQAIDGFTAAANLWKEVLANDITINIEIGFRSLGPNVIGETGSDFIERSYPTVTAALETQRTSADDYASHAALQPGATFNRIINHTSNSPNGANSAEPYVDSMNRVGITTANAKALGLLGPRSERDAVIRFSSDFSFDFNHGTTISPGHYDFVGAAAHEIGHALGFVSGVDDIDTANGQSPGGNFSSNMIDLFRYSQESLKAGIGYTDYTADNRLKYFSVDGGNSMAGAFANGVVFGDGRQASHWKDNLGLGIMDPTANLGERLSISYNDLRVFDVMGYTLVPEPSVMTLFGLAMLWLLWRHTIRRQTPQ